MTERDPYERLDHFLPPAEDLGIEGYEILGPLGEGGFGRVFRARQLAFDRDVAVKVLNASGLQEETARRFERECRAVGSLSGHPNIVTVLDSGITPWGRPYIVMDHMAGGSLAQGRADGRGADAFAATAIIVKICGAVETAHRAGILHRDIKPENLLLSAYGEPKLGDFGVASIPDGYQTRTGAITASLAHAAPEVLEGGRATPAVDIYALGSTLFTLISGRAPFASEEHSGLQSLIARTLTQPVPDLRADGVPDEICSVIEKAMAKDPAARYATAAALGDALRDAQRALGLQPTEMVLAEPSPELLAHALSSAADDLSRTQIRKRPVLSPPAPPSAPRPWWRSPLIAAAVLLLLAAATASALNLRGTGETGTPAAALTTSQPDASATPPEVASIEDGGKAPDRRSRRPKSLKTGRGDKTQHAGGVTIPSAGGGATGGSTSGGGGSSTGDGAAPTSGGGGGSAGGGGGSTGGSGGGGGSSEPKPDPIPIPTVELWHLWSDDRYYFTTDQGDRAEVQGHYSNWHREAVVWEYGGSGMRRICFGDGRCGGWVYAEPPEGMSTRPLYAFSARYGDYYTINPDEIPAEYSGYRLYVFGYVPR
ncbi:MAG: serine/threonine protein kinase [Actinomycetota bacterium]|nr:serine/threonine protein kinase [Actinomycetota bacterium]